MKKEGLPKGSIEVISLLENHGALTQKDIINNLESNKSRAVRYTIRRLVEKSILVYMANFEDMRSSLIAINKNKGEFLENIIRKVTTK